MTDDAAMPAPARPRLAALASPVAWVALIALAAIAYYVSGPLGPDVSWLITVSERIRAGQVLYVDILEPNPPVAGYLYMLPVLLAEVIGVKPEPLVVVYTIGFGLLTSGIAARIVTESGLLQRGELLWPVAFLIVGVAWGDEFGQREHFAAMSALPLLACTALRAAGQRPGTWAWIAGGVCGGFILAIKPHFALAIALPALYAAIRQRSVRPIVAPEHWLAGVLFLGFVALIWLAFPGFFTNILPVAADAYVPDRRSLIVMAGLFVLLIFWALLAVGLIGFWRKVGHEPVLGAIFFAAIGFLLAYFSQGRGYTYQVMPAIALMTVFLVMAFAQEIGRRTFGKVLVVAAAAVLSSIWIINDIHQRGVHAPLYDAVRPYGPGLRFGNLLPDLTAASPLHRVLDGELINSPPALLMTLSVLRLRHERMIDPAWAERLDAIEDAERDRFRADMVARPADIVLTAATGFDWFEWAREDAALAAILDGYEDIGTVPFDGYDVRLLRRRGLEPVAP